MVMEIQPGTDAPGQRHVSRRTLGRVGAMLTGALALGALVGGQFGAAAQDATPDAGSAAHPGHIHMGTCAELGEVMFPLSPAAPVEGEGTGPETALRVAVSESTVDATLDDIIAGGHAINFHESEENIQNYIACGDIGGVVVDGTLTIGLGELNDSGFTGVAILSEDGEQTNVSVYLVPSDAGAATAATPAGDATPAADSGEAATEGNAVDIIDFGFPETLEVSVGTTVTWTNQDTAPHTVTSEPAGDVFNSGKLDQGDTFSFTFEEAGTYEYYCEYHANMKGTVVVS